MTHPDTFAVLVENLSKLRLWFLQTISVRRGEPDRGYALGAEGAAWIVDHILRHKPRRVVELGCGFSTLAFGYACAESGSRLITADHDAQWLDDVRAVLGMRDEEHRKLGESTFRVDEWSSLDALRGRVDLRASCDLAIIDHGPLSKTRLSDLPWISSLMSQDGIMALDDCRTFTPYEQRARSTLLPLGFCLERAEASFGRKRYIGVARRIRS
jgi:predicted O-methyltransferase YrrM